MNKIHDRDVAIQEARDILSGRYIVLDTETTGLNEPEACQVAWVHEDGTSFVGLCKPTKSIEQGAFNVHHISNEMVANAPSIVDLMVRMPLSLDDVSVVIYNANFDTKVVERSCAAGGSNFSFHNKTVHDAMLMYAAFRGEWNDYRGNYKWWKLGEAIKQCGIETQGELHDAAEDARMTRLLVIYMANQKKAIEAVEWPQRLISNPTNHYQKITGIDFASPDGDKTGFYLPSDEDA